MGSKFSCNCDKGGEDANSEIDISGYNSKFQNNSGLDFHKSLVIVQSLIMKKLNSKKLLEKMKQRIYLHKSNSCFEEISISSFEKAISDKVNQILSRLEQNVRSMKIDSKGRFRVKLVPMENKQENLLYLGEWNTQGDKCGLGKLIHLDGSIYYGFFLNNYFEGLGIHVQPNGDYYLGEWTNGRAEGIGNLILYDNSIKYEGKWKDNKKNGEGEEFYADGAYYKGNFSKNEKDGLGVYVWPDKTHYKGIFNMSMLNGNGEMFWRDGRIYKGCFLDNKMHGRGLLTWPNGSYYDGEYRNNSKFGEGKFSWSNERFYKGQWLNNKQHGPGYVASNGKIYQGVWRFGKVIKIKEISA